MIGNPSNTKNNYCWGDMDFETSTLKSTSFWLHFLHHPLNSIMAGCGCHYYRAKCADIKISGWFFACPSGTWLPGGPIEPNKGPYSPKKTFMSSHIILFSSTVTDPKASGQHTCLVQLLIFSIEVLLDESTPQAPASLCRPPHESCKNWKTREHITIW